MFDWGEKVQRNSTSYAVYTLYIDIYCWILSFLFQIPWNAVQSRESYIRYPQWTQGQGLWGRAITDGVWGNGEEAQRQWAGGGETAEEGRGQWMKSCQAEISEWNYVRQRSVSGIMSGRAEWNFCQAGVREWNHVRLGSLDGILSDWGQWMESCQAEVSQRNHVRHREVGEWNHVRLRSVSGIMSWWVEVSEWNHVRQRSVSGMSGRGQWVESCQTEVREWNCVRCPWVESCQEEVSEWNHSLFAGLDMFYWPAPIILIKKICTAQTICNDVFTKANIF